MEGNWITSTTYVEALRLGRQWYLLPCELDTMQSAATFGIRKAAERP